MHCLGDGSRSWNAAISAAPGGAPLPVILLTGLVLGSLLDQFLPVIHDRAKLWRIVLDFAFAIGAVTWFRNGTLDLWCLVIIVPWGILQIRAHSHTGRNTTPAVMMLTYQQGDWFLLHGLEIQPVTGI